MKLTLKTITPCAASILLCAAACWGSGENGAAIPNSAVKLYVTYQEYEADSPWKKSENKGRAGYGCVLPSNRILTTGDIVKDHTLIEVQKSMVGEHFTARVEVVDYDVDLAILTVEDDAFFSDLAPVEFDRDISIDQPIQFLVFEESGQIRAMPGTIVKVTVDEYYLGWDEYLIYGATASFEGRGGGWSEPVFSNGRMVGLSMSYSSEKQYASIIPASIILHFLDAIKNGAYTGFPSPGFRYTALRNPDLKNFLGLPHDTEGIYVRYIVPGGSAERALRVGDVVTSVDGFELDWDGNYLHPDWGRLNFSDRITRYHYPGETVEVGVLRDGKPATIKMKLKRFDQSKYLVPVICCDTRPRYIIIGGLVIQELTADYIKSWGKNWKNRANKKFLYYYKYEAQAQKPDRKRVVILNKVLPDNVNIGYQGIDNLVVSKVNGRPISEIGDVAEALGSPENGFHRFTFEEYDREIILDKDKMAEADKRIGAQYGIARMRNVE